MEGDPFDDLGSIMFRDVLTAPKHINKEFDTIIMVNHHTDFFNIHSMNKSRQHIGSIFSIP